MMVRENFVTITHAKCILAGEHSVLRGCPALVAPVTTKNIKLSFIKGDDGINMLCQSPYETTFMTYFWKTLEYGLAELKINLCDLHGVFKIDNNIPMGGGIGFSSALCTAITKWMIWNKWIPQHRLYEFSKKLENIFHGKSSGLDIAGAITDHILHFEKSGHTHDIPIRWLPRLYLSFSGSAKDTAKVIHVVNSIRKKSPKLAVLIDKEMRESVMLVENALSVKRDEGLKKLVLALQHADHCFQEWGLITPEMEQHKNKLYQLGALTVKPTGAGMGGYMLSLWENEPEFDDEMELIPVF